MKPEKDAAKMTKVEARPNVKLNSSGSINFLILVISIVKYPLKPIFRKIRQVKNAQTLISDNMASIVPMRSNVHMANRMYSSFTELYK